MKEEVIKKTIERILEEHKIKVLKIILFGSRARGDYKERSDWDLLIVIDKKLLREERLKISHLIRKALADEFIPCDVLIKSEEEFEKRKGVIGSVIRSAIGEGIIL
ncbi:MAG: nucleotidyltransferase domain-containing protein [Candidatus Aenigmatarchaeota archaeon]